MSQIDKVSFFPILLWIFMGYLIWYIYVNIVLVPKCYKILRVRYLWELNIYEGMNKYIYKLELLIINFYIWSKNLLLDLLKKEILYFKILNLKF